MPGPNPGRGGAGRAACPKACPRPGITIRQPRLRGPEGTCTQSVGHWPRWWGGAGRAAPPAARSRNQFKFIRLQAGLAGRGRAGDSLRRPGRGPPGRIRRLIHWARLYLTSDFIPRLPHRPRSPLPGPSASPDPQGPPSLLAPPRRGSPACSAQGALSPCRRRVRPGSRQSPRQHAALRCGWPTLLLSAGTAHCRGRLRREHDNISSTTRAAAAKRATWRLAALRLVRVPRPAPRPLTRCGLQPPHPPKQEAGAKDVIAAHSECLSFPGAEFVAAPRMEGGLRRRGTVTRHARWLPCSPAEAEAGAQGPKGAAPAGPAGPAAPLQVGLPRPARQPSAPERTAQINNAEKQTV